MKRNGAYKQTFMERILGLDVGTKRIGVAIGDDIGIVITGKEAISRKPEHLALKRIDEICNEYRIKKIVVGIPYHANGDFGEQAKDCEQFASLLKDKYDIFFEDERCSSFEAEENLKNRGVNFRKNKELIDIESACIILKQFINRKRVNYGRN